MLNCGVTTLTSSMVKGGEPQPLGCKTLAGGKFVTGWCVWMLPLVTAGEWMGNLGSCLVTVTSKPEAPPCPFDHGTGEPSGAERGKSYTQSEENSSLPKHPAC